MRKIDLTKVQAATSEIARDINRRIVLNLVRSKQPISRADLARFSGLQRSTVSAIAEQLIADDWIQEGPTGRLPRGRRPTYLRLNDKRAILGVDIRPTNTTIAVSDLHAQFLVQESLPTPRDAKTAIQKMCEKLAQQIESHSEYSFEGVGISLPGRTDPTTGKLAFAPNLGWRDVDLMTPIAKATGLEVYLENAANACALAEVWFGDVEAAHDLVVITVSEGIGAGILVNGQVVRGLGGMGGEFGHMVLDPEGPPCRCGNRGCWETFASNSAAVRYYSESAAGEPQISFQDLLSLASQNQVQALKALEKMARHIGIGLSHVVNGLAPHLVVFVGEVTRAWARVGPIIENEVRARSIGGAVPRLVASSQTAAPRLRGTIALVLQKHFGAPVLA